MSSPRRHLDDLFSAAYEDELSPIDEARFHTHMQSCAPCAAAYAEFRATIEALHELPRARMPHVVHLPSTPPVAERPSRPRVGLSWFNLGLVRRFPATAIAGVAAAVIVIVALTHNGGGGTPNNTAGSAALPVVGSAQGAGDAGCTHSIASITGTAIPSNFTQESLATDPAQPALRLVLASPTLVVTAGQQSVVYAQLSEPLSSLSNPGTAATPLPARAVLPCVSIQVVSTGQRLAANADGLPGVQVPGAPAVATPAAPPGLPFGTGVGPLLTFQVPAGLAPRTEIRVIATIPAGYAGALSAPLTAELTLTTR